MIESFKKWVNENPGRRHVRINIGDCGDSNHFRVWAYDYDLGIGQDVKNADEINLECTVEERERSEYERLKEKYDG